MPPSTSLESARSTAAHSEAQACVVLGAGSTGASAALMLAKAGVPTLLIDARARGRTGASWLNLLDIDVFDTIDERPPSQVVHANIARYILCSDDGLARVAAESPPVKQVDMRALNGWLVDRCEAEGVELLFGTHAKLGPWVDGLRHVHLGGKVMRAAVVLDARGFSASRAEHDKASAELCSALQAQHMVRDLAGARAWLAQHNARPGDFLSFTQANRGYAGLNVFVNFARERVNVMAGVLHGEGQRGPRDVLADFVRDAPWVGEQLEQGGGQIPLRPTRHDFVDDGVIRIGDAAGNVTPIAGTGTSYGIYSAALAAEVVSAQLVGTLSNARTGTPPALHRAALWTYNVQFQRKFGQRLAAQQPFKYLS